MIHTQNVYQEKTHITIELHVCCITWAGHLNTSDLSSTGFSYPYFSVLHLFLSKTAEMHRQNTFSAHFQTSYFPLKHQAERGEK